MLAERKQLAPTPPCSGPEQVLLSSWAAPEEKICRQAGRRQPIGNRSGWLTLSRIVVIILVAATASAIFPLPQVTPFSRNTNSSLPSESQVSIQHSLVTPHTPLANLPGVQKTLLLSSDSLLSGNYINSGTAYEPNHFFFDPLNGLLYISEQAAGRVAVINTTTDLVVANISVGVYPEGLTLDNNSGLLYVDNVGINGGSQTISLINTTTNTVVKNLTSGVGPWMIVYDPITASLYSTNRISDNVTIINAKTNQVSGSIPVGSGPYGIVLDKTNGLLYVANDNASTVSIINPATNQVVGTLPVGSEPQAPWYDSSNNDIYVPDWGSSNLTIISGSSNTIIGAIPLGSLPQVAAGLPHSELYVSNSGSNNLTVVNDTSNSVMGSIPVGLHPDGIQFVPKCNCVFVANLFSDSISIISLNASIPLQTSLRLDSSNSGYSPLTVTMSANATGGTPPYAYSWNFGDGSSGSGLTVSHTFTCNVANGTSNVCTYLVVVTAVDSNGVQATATASVRVINPNGSGGALLSYITFSTPTVGYAPLLVTMSAQVSGGVAPYSDEWGFGDGSTGSGQQVSHVYDVPATGCSAQGCTFTISLVTDDSGGHVATSTAQVTLLNNNQSSFTVTLSENPASGVAPLQTNFSAAASSGAPPYTFVWAFGDGATAAGASIHHQYSVAGTYSVVVTAVDSRGAVAQATSTVLVYPQPQGNQTGGLEVGVSGDPLTGPAPLSPLLQVMATGGHAPYNYTWNFGDNSSEDWGADVTHTYTHVGQYVATVTVEDAAGNLAMAGLIVSVTGGSQSASQLEVLVAAFNMHGSAPLSTTFAPEVVGGSAPYHLSWTFGDGQSTLMDQVQPITHTYRNPGTYAPQLTVTDSAGHVVTWTSTAQNANHPSVVVTGSTTSSTPFLYDWYLIALGAIAVVVIALLLSVQTRKGKEVSGDKSNLGDTNPYSRYHSTIPTRNPSKWENGRRLLPPEPIDPSVVYDPLGDSL